MLATASALVIAFSGAAQQTTFRGGVDLVPVYVTVTDARGAFVPYLTQDRFTIRDDGQEQKVELFEAGDQPITIAILLDRSPSLFNEVARTQAAVAEFARRLLPGDRACLGFFSHIVSLDPTLTDNPDVLLRHLGDPAPLPAGTALWDALDAARLALRQEAGRRVVLVVTDAADNASRSDLEEVRRNIEQDGLLLYVIAVRGRGGLQTANLETLSRSSGGTYFELKATDDLSKTMERVADELRSQYVLAFGPQRLDGKRHRIEVRLRLPIGDPRRNATVRARRSYIAVRPGDAR